MARLHLPPDRPIRSLKVKIRALDLTGAPVQVIHGQRGSYRPRPPPPRRVRRLPTSPCSRSGFFEYLCPPFTNATATMPLWWWAKMAMLTQSVITRATVVLVVARAVNVLAVSPTSRYYQPTAHKLISSR